MPSVEVREPTDAELAALYRTEAEHVLGTLDGVPMVYLSFRRIEGRLWGMFGVLAPIGAHQCRALFYRLRRCLLEKTEPVYGLARDEGTERLVRLMGLQPTDEVYAGKKVFIWIPER